MRNFFQDVFDIKDDFNIKLNNLPDKDLQEMNRTKEDENNFKQSTTWWFCKNHFCCKSINVRRMGTTMMVTLSYIVDPKTEND